MLRETASVSIGDLAAATGLGPDTIRAWERRYGRPKPARLPSGHRRYTRAQLRWLRRVAEAVALGHRPGAAVRAGEEELAAMLDKPLAGRRGAELLDGTMPHVRALDRQALAQALRERLAALGPRRFVTECIVPLATHIGRLWADGEVEVRHEHFATEGFEDALRSLRMSLPAADRGLAVLATLPGETHGLGLQTVALLCALNRVRTRILGTEMPSGEIVRAVRELRAPVVVLSVSLARNGKATGRELTALRRALPADAQLVIGGAGARGLRRPRNGIELVDSLEGFETWLRARFGAAG